jgi:hypothetical protein
MMLKQVIYWSQPFGFDSAMLGSILLAARRNNRRDGVSGALLCRHDIYLQLIEGPGNAIDTLYARILRDDRHLDVRPLWSGAVAARMFPDWDMLDDPAHSWMWSAAEVADDAVGRASVDEVRAVFARVARDVAAPVFA